MVQGRLSRSLRVTFDAFTEHKEEESGGGKPTLSANARTEGG